MGKEISGQQAKHFRKGEWGVGNLLRVFCFVLFFSKDKGVSPFQTMWAHTHTQSFQLETGADRKDKHGRDRVYIWTAMLLQKSRAFKERLACNSLTKDVLILFTVTESKKVDTSPSLQSLRACMSATTKWRTILPHDTLFLGERNACSWSSHTDNCCFCSLVRIQASIVQLPQTLGRRSKGRIEKKETQLVGLKMESCTICNKTQPKAIIPGSGKGGRTMGRDWSSRLIQYKDSVFASLPAWCHT